MVDRSNIIWHHALITRSARQKMNGHRSLVVWFTGLSGSGKSTLSHAVEQRLHEIGCRTLVLDGDNVRHGLCGDLGFSEDDRSENIRRIGEMAKLLTEAGVITLTAFISPFRADRLRARELFAPEDFVEAYCRCPLEVCEGRDVKGMYRRARAGEIPDFTGISSPYEEPLTPDLTVDTGRLSLEQCVDQVIACLKDRGVLPPP
ncbi:adenylyl-sulfate kinase [Propionivibrio sp.]|uniref:adenylyl-sulfate kinase n=1 Tax=Propionivibrio sp. TaxID=2212460 RepID=UPI0025D7E204|nr:adenylyl-sulfate kinase [Propionivibrio sp.]MBK8399862.1 adenylyl-sulfate kinase [Propionivibrio sp.]MBK8743248.1 adenylyl-sulfate kinase [Propionivibrio sp.]